MTGKRPKRRQYETAGRRAETLAALYLRLKGYHIVERRFRCADGEIDIIARRGGVLAIIEVKQRASQQAVEESLTPYLMRRVSRAADTYVARHSAVQKLAIRFDAVFVIGRWRISHMPDAWR